MKILELPANFLPWLMKTNENSKFVRLSFMIYKQRGEDWLKESHNLKIIAEIPSNINY